MKKIILLLVLLFSSFDLDLSATEVTPTQLEDGVFTIGTDCGYAPYSFVNAQESTTAVQISGSTAMCDGYDIMIAQQIADYLNVELEVKLISFDGLVPALNSGQIDAIAAGMTPTPERQESLDFSNNYHEDDLGLSIVVNANGDYADAQSINDFAGATLSSQLGTFHGDFLPQIPDITIAAPMEGFDGLMQATKSGTIDGYINEDAAAIEQAQSDEDLVEIEIPNGEDGFVGVEDFAGVAMGVTKGSTQFVDLLNQALSTISPSQREQMMEEAAAKGDGTYVAETNILKSTWDLFINNKELYANGIITTLVLALTGTVFGSLLGIILVLMRIQKSHYKDKLYVKIFKKTVSLIATVYIDIVRGTPMMVQAMIFFYGLVANILEPNTAGMIIISFNTAAYIAEILRSGINGIDSGQMEAGRSLGLSLGQTYISIIIPQAIKNSVPALANELIVNIKDSSVLSVIAVSELFYSTKQAASAGYHYTEAYIIAALIYLFLTISLTRLLNFGLKKLMDDNSSESIMTLQSIEEVITND